MTTFTDWEKKLVDLIENSDLSWTEIAAQTQRDRGTILKFARFHNLRKQKSARIGPIRKEDLRPLSAHHKAVGLRLSNARGLDRYSDSADRIGTNRHIARIMETGAHDFTLSELIRIAEALDMNLARLIEPFTLETAVNTRRKGDNF